MEIDLGEDVFFNIKLNGKVYKLLEPTVDHLRKYQKNIKIKKDGDEELDSFMSLLVDIGLPEDVSKSLGFSKLKKLSDGIVGGLDIKK